MKSEKNTTNPKKTPTTRHRTLITTKRLRELSRNPHQTKLLTKTMKRRRRPRFRIRSRSRLMIIKTITMRMLAATKLSEAEVVVEATVVAATEELVVEIPTTDHVATEEEEDAEADPRPQPTRMKMDSQ